MDELFERRLLRRLEPDQVMANLTGVGVALTLYELLRVQVLNVVDFMSLGQEHFDNDGITHKSGFKECVPWLEDVDAITKDDAATIYEIRDYRNQLAHESTSLIIDPSVEVQDELIERGIWVHRKLELYWTRLWADMDPVYDSRAIRDENIGLPASSLLDHIVDTWKSTTAQ